MWRDVKLASELLALLWWLQGHPSADCLLGYEAVMFLTVMERLSSQWQCGYDTHSAAQEGSEHSWLTVLTQPSEQDNSLHRGRSEGLLGHVDIVSSGAKSGGRTINISD